MKVGDLVRYCDGSTGIVLAEEVLLDDNSGQWNQKIFVKFFNDPRRMDATDWYYAWRVYLADSDFEVISEAG